VSYLKIFVTILHIAVSLFVIISVLLQPAKVQGLSKAISGGAETFFGKNKGRSYEGKLQKMTEIGMVLFVITSIALVYFSNH
jgi:preprotein translocase subunit SecG